MPNNKKSEKKSALFSKKIDPIKFELIRNSLFFLVNEMALSLVRSSYSGILRDNMDFSTGIADRSGEMVAQGLSLPLQFGPMPDAIAAVCNRWSENMNNGDVFILNDPFEGGTHLPDVFFIKPLFINKKLFCFICVCGHQIDVGGRVAGSNASDSREIFAEGIRIPPLKLIDAGKQNETLFSIIEKNVRLPVNLFGDFRAHLAALKTGENGIYELIQKYSAKELQRYFKELLDNAERITRNAISKIPNGVYKFTDYIDCDGVELNKVPIKVEVQIRDDSVIVDTSGSSTQVQGAINSTYSMTKAVSYFAIRSIIEDDMPNNGGFFRPITVIAEEGSIMKSILPAASGARGVTLLRLGDAVLGALSKAVPKRVMAANEGGPTLYSFGGYDSTKNPFIFVEIFGGSWGGRPNKDGIDGIGHPLCNQRNIPVEYIEMEYPLRINGYGYVPNSGGAGQYRGGLALFREFKYIGDTPCQLQIRSDRSYTPPYGLQNGENGSLSKNILNPDTNKEKVLPPMVTFILNPDEVVRFIIPGAGGWGKPGNRNFENLLYDIKNGYLTERYARKKYKDVFLRSNAKN